ncbi:MAG: shikimate kinase [Inquilinaceae bacterium]
MTVLPARRPDCAIVLVGLMGAGKSAIGRRLAARMGMRFVDADREVEEAAGCSIEDIFDRYGEAAFRDVERRVIARLLNGEPHVLATGGGAFMDEETRSLIARRGVSIWLRADIQLLLTRTARRNNRPLLRQGDPEAILKALMDERHPVYALAEIVVDSRDGPPDDTVDDAVRALDKLLEQRQSAEAPGD